ncbi:hypothetical protein [Streptomyces sp. LN325]|uniref:hypothetical protein n=1 Tax=Streptomyces sp. LN325 TaxID=3112976 RepID=UPI003717E9AD
MTSLPGGSRSHSGPPPPGARTTSRPSRWTARSCSRRSAAWSRSPCARSTGRNLAVAGIHLSDTPPLRYESELFYEKELRSVTSNTREDGRGFEPAVRHRVRATTHTYPLSEAQRALRDLKGGRFEAAVLVNDLLPRHWSKGAGRIPPTDMRAGRVSGALLGRVRLGLSR